MLRLLLLGLTPIPRSLPPRCANRLAQGIGAPLVHAQLRRLKLSANWVLMAAFERPLGLPWEGAFVRSSEELAWAANNSAKLRGGGGGAPECWTLISTQRYGKANKVPQEAVPPEVAQRVTAELLAAFARSLGRTCSSLPPVAYSRVQLWGAALPQNSPGVPCILDPASRVGVCGDWLLGSSMEAAVLSGMALADQISLLAGQPPKAVAGLAVGLHTPFQRIQGEEMGQFPEASAAAPAARVPSICWQSDEVA